MKSHKICGKVFNIQHFSVHDGPGIRTVVFLKGCPLHCIWCANPESQNPETELGWTKEKCIGCESCIKSESPYNFRFGEEGLLWDSVNVSETVEAVCPSKALHVIGSDMTVGEVLAEVEKDYIFYSNSEGGITVSGGEPLMQPEFTYRILKEAGNRSIHRSIETTGFAQTDIFLKIAGETDYLLMDIKSMDNEVHKKYTGVSNEIILKNAKAVREKYPKLQIHFRTPVIPGINDSDDAIKAIHDFVMTMDNVQYELLKYHRLGEGKYDSIHREYEMGTVELPDDKYKELKQKYEYG
jgi:pyruvate formate lyase activating enzyme